MNHYVRPMRMGRFPPDSIKGSSAQDGETGWRYGKDGLTFDGSEDEWVVAIGNIGKYFIFLLEYAFAMNNYYTLL